MRKLQIAQYGYILMSIVFYIMGLLCFISFEISPFWLCIVSGITLIVYGVIKIMGYLSNDLYCLAFQYDLACGLFLIVLGLVVIGYNQSIHECLSMGLGALILLDSLLKIQISKDAKVFGLENWKRMLIFSILSGILGFLVMIKSFSVELPSHFITGCALLLEGFMNQCIIHDTVKNKKDHLLQCKNSF